MYKWQLHARSGLRSKIHRASPPSSAVVGLSPDVLLSRRFPDTPWSATDDPSLSKSSTRNKNEIRDMVSFPSFCKNLHCSSWLGGCAECCQYNNPLRIRSSSGYGFSKSTRTSRLMSSKFGGADVYLDSLEAYERISVKLTLARWALVSLKKKVGRENSKSFTLFSVASGFEFFGGFGQVLIKVCGCRM